MPSLTILTWSIATLNPGSGPAWDSDKEAPWIIISPASMSPAINCRFVHFWFPVCAIKMYHPIWYWMGKTLEMGQIYLLRCRLQSAFWHQVCNASNLCNYNFENHEDAAAKANNMHCTSPRCLESVGQLIQNQQKMLPTHSLHLHMGKSILVSNYLTEQKVTSLYWEECWAWQSCHICHLWEDKNGCLVSFFNNIYYFAFSNFLDSSDSVAPARIESNEGTLCFHLRLGTLQNFWKMMWRSSKNN